MQIKNGRWAGGTEKEGARGGNEQEVEVLPS